MVGIILDGEIDLSPFSKKYTDVMDEKNIPYEIIHWNRSGREKSVDKNCRTYFEQVDRYGNIISKIMPFLRFRSFAKKTVKERKYDKLIILTTQTALILADVVLSRKYKNRYFFDYRDTSYEYIAPYRRFINKIIMRSYATGISSPGFRKYLTDKKELVTAHNFQDIYYESRVLKCPERKKEGRLVLGYIGYLREFEYLKKFADIFGSDERFEFNIHGGGDCVDELREYAAKYPNVRVFGAYKEEDKMDIVDSFDMICYNYPSSFVNYPAVANKFYDGMIRKKPMFGNSGTYSGELISRYGLGISLAENEKDINNKIYNYFENFDREEFEKNCEEFLNTVIEDDKKYIDTINKFLES